MRWFKHDCDMHTDLKIQALIDKHGLEGYALWCICLELLGKEGKKGVLNSQSGWRNALLKISGWSDNGKFDGVLTTMADLHLINGKSLKYGNLYIPKFIKRVDTYTARSMRRECEQSSHNVPVDIDIDKTKIKKEDIDQIRGVFLGLKSMSEDSLKPDDYGRYGNSIKMLLFKADYNVSTVNEGLHWLSETAEGKYDWTLETLVKKWPNFLTWFKMTPFEQKYLKGNHDKRR